MRPGNGFEGINKKTGQFTNLIKVYEISSEK